MTITRAVIIGLTTCGLALGGVGSAEASLILLTDVEVTGTGLGAVNTLVTVHDPGGPGTQNGTESGCINQDGSLSPCLAGVEGGDNTAINQVLSFANTSSFAAVVNIAEIGGSDLSVTLTDLYLTFAGSGGTYTATYDGGPLDLVAGTGTGTGGSGFVFGLDAAQAAIVAGLGPSLTISGGVQFANGSTSDGNETVYVIQTEGTPTTPVPEPASLTLLGLGLCAAGSRRLRRRLIG